MNHNHSVQAGVSIAVVAAGSLLFIAAADGGVRLSAREPFDLAIQEVSVKQLSSTPMFRTVEITCVMESRGPSPSNATGSLSISRPGEGAPQVLKTVPIPKSMPPGDRFLFVSQTVAWSASAIPYRCEIQFGGSSAAGDADPTNDFGEFTFPTL